MLAYDGEQLQFGPDYLIPKPFDARVLIWEASAVAEAAVSEGKARVKDSDFDVDKYREELGSRLGMTRSIMRRVINQAKRDEKLYSVRMIQLIKAAAQCISEGICDPILLGQIERIQSMKAELNLDFECEVIDVRYDVRRRGLYARRIT